MMASIRALPRRPRPAVNAGACPLCGALAAELLRRDCRDRLLEGAGRWEIVRCLQCGLARTEPRPQPADLARAYETSYFEDTLGVPADNGAGPEHPPVPRSRALLSRVLDAPYHVRYGATGVPEPPEAGATVLDVGPGAGEELAEHARKGWEAWAVEPSRIAARAVAARAKIPAQRIIVASAEEARLPAEQFDRVVMSHVIEHLSDPRGVLQSVRESMRPNAMLTIRCPNFGSIERRLFGRWWAGLDVPRHLQHFTRVTLSTLLAQCGLRAVKVRPQLDYASVSLSLGFMLRDVPRPRSSSWLDLACLPVVALARALGAAGMLEVEARRR